MENQELYNLLIKIDDGYMPTDREYFEITSSTAIKWDSISVLPKSMSKLSALVCLELIDFRGNDISILSCLKSLKELKILLTDVTDISSLSKLSNLEKLFINHADVDNIDALSCLVSLKELNLLGTKVNDLNALSNLCNLVHLNLANTEVNDISVLSILNDLESLDLSKYAKKYSSTDYNQISDISALANLTKLKKLGLCGIGVSNISVLSELTVLRKLDLSMNTELVEIDALMNLSLLESLNLCRTKVTDISVLSNLHTIANLNLSKTGAENVEVLFQLPNLQYVRMSEKQHIEALLAIEKGKHPSKAIENELASVQKLRIEKIEVLPGTMKYLKNLKDLDLSYTQVRDISALSRVRGLITLDLKFTKVSDIRAISECKSLRTLDLRGSEVFDISDISGLKKLEVLNISGTAVQDISHLYGMNLKTLNLQETQVSEIQALSSLVDLRELDLSCTRVKDISALSGLHSLIRLNLWETLIDDISSLSQLKCLEYLNLAVTNVSDISMLTMLHALKDLDLSGTQVTDIHALEHLYNLKKLSLAWVQVKDISALSGLIGLTSLNLFQMPVSDISPLIRLQKLVNLNLSRMHLVSIPEFLLNLNIEFINEEYGDGNGIYIKDLSLENQPIEIFFSPRNSIIEYYKTQRVYVKEPLNECKIVLLGNGGAGKSSLLHRILRGGIRIEDYVGTSTKGVAVDESIVKIDGKSIRVTYWDFGGQEIFHSMHRLFMTNRTLYIIIVDARESNINRQAQFWLNEVKQFTNASQVLLIINKIDYNPFAMVDEIVLKSAYPFLSSIVRGSILLDSDENFRTRIVDAITNCIMNMDTVSTRIPVSWKKIINDIRSLKSSVISEEKFESICHKHEMEDYQELRAPLIDWLEDLGIVFFLSPKSAHNRSFITRPVWLLNAISSILAASGNISRNGFIPKKDILYIINQQLDEHKHDIYAWEELKYLIEALHEFELSFSVSKEVEFFPMYCKRLDKNLIPQVVDKGEKHIIYEYDFPSYSFVQRLIVKMKESIDYENVWYDGAIFHNNSRRYRLFVQSIQNSIHIYTEPIYATYIDDSYLNLLRSKLQQVNHDLNIVSKEYICYQENGVEEKFSYEELLASKKAGLSKLYSQKIKKVISIDNILGVEAYKKRNIVNDIIKYLRQLQDNRFSLEGYEDSLDLYVRNLLGESGYYCKDQRITRDNKIVGEIDILIADPGTGQEYPYEGLLLSSFGLREQQNMLTKMQKILSLYNHKGSTELFFVLYAYWSDEYFEKNIDKILQFITSEKEVKSSEDIYMLIEYEQVNTNEPFLRCIKTTYVFGGVPISLYYMVVKMLDKRSRH